MEPIWLEPICMSGTDIQIDPRKAAAAVTPGAAASTVIILKAAASTPLKGRRLHRHHPEGHRLHRHHPQGRRCQTAYVPKAIWRTHNKRKASPEALHLSCGASREI